MMRKAIVIDDEDELRAVFSFALEEHAFTVLQYARVSEALTYLTSHTTPHLVITDYLMPEMNGEAFLRQAIETRHLRQHRYILAAARPLSWLPPTVESFLTTWHIPFLEKPFLLEDFDTLIQSLLS